MSKFDITPDNFTNWYVQVPKIYMIWPARGIIEEMYEYYTKLFRERMVEPFANLDNLISARQMARIKKAYTGTNFEADKNMLINVYSFIGITAVHLSIPPFLRTHELFGSPLNTTADYCSPFEFERAFGSSGNFFEFDIVASKHNILTCNPPFVEDIMRMAAERLVSELDRAAAAGITKTIVITIPVWDPETQRRLRLKDYGMPFAAFDILKGSKYFLEHDVLDKFKYRYYDYYKNKLIPACFSHLIIFGNGRPAITASEVKKKWLAAAKHF